MKKNLFITVLFLICVVFVFDAFAAVSKRYYKDKETTTKVKVKTEDAIRTEVGLNIQEWGIAIDAMYDPRLDALIPGYRIVNLVLTNKRAEPIYLHTTKDRWYVVDNMGKKHRAYNHVKEFDAAIWEKLPKKMQDMLAYPHVVNPGNSATIDVFLPKTVDLFRFREVVWKSDHFSKEFNVFTNYENNLALDKNEFTTPGHDPVDEAKLEELEKLDKQTPYKDFNNQTTTPNAKSEQLPQNIEINELNANTTQKTPDATVDGFIRVK